MCFVSLVFRVSGFGFLVSSFRFRVSGFGFQVSSFGFRVSGFGFPGNGSASRPARPASTGAPTAPPSPVKTHKRTLGFKVDALGCGVEAEGFRV